MDNPNFLGYICGAAGRLSKMGDWWGSSMELDGVAVSSAVESVGDGTLTMRQYWQYLPCEWSVHPCFFFFAVGAPLLQYDDNCNGVVCTVGSSAVIVFMEKQSQQTTRVSCLDPKTCATTTNTALGAS